MTGLLHRLARHTGVPLLPHASSLIPAANPTAVSTWATSISEWLAQGSLHLAIGGSPSSHTLDEDLQSFFTRHDSPLPPNVLASFHASSLHYVGDILCPTSRGPCWIQIPPVPTLLLDFSLPPTPPPTHLHFSLALRPFQCWLLRDQQRVLEIIGRSTSDLHSIYVRYWLPPHRSNREVSRAPLFQLGASLLLDPNTLSRGAASDIALLDDTLYLAIARDSTRIILSGDIPCASLSGVRRQILALVPLQHPPSPLSSPLDLPLNNTLSFSFSISQPSLSKLPALQKMYFSVINGSYSGTSSFHA